MRNVISCNTHSLPRAWIVPDENPNVLIAIVQSWRRFYTRDAFRIIAIRTLRRYGIYRALLVGRRMNRDGVNDRSRLVEGQTLIRVHPRRRIFQASPEEVLKMYPPSRQMFDQDDLVLCVYERNWLSILQCATIATRYRYLIIGSDVKHKGSSCPALAGNCVSVF